MRASESSVPSGAMPPTALELSPRAANAFAPDFDRVYRDYVAFVWRRLRRMGIPQAEVADVAHEVFIIVHRKLADFDGRASIAAWLFGITRGVVSNWRKAEQRRERRLTVAPIPGAPPSPDDHASAGEARAMIERFLDSLDADKRIVFELADVEGLRAREIGEIVGTNIHTVNSRLRAARLRFRALLDASDQGGG